MAVNNPFKIKWGSREVGGTSDAYQLIGPYVIDKTFTNLRLVFDVIVVGTSYSANSSGLQQRSDALETDFRKRDQTLIITINSTTWTYTFGTDILNATASLAKTGDSETDRGFSRSYTCVVEAELPADDAALGGRTTTGLRDIAWNVDFEAGRARVVTVQGTYTALSGTNAVSKYQAAGGADAEFTAFIAAIDSSGTYELVDETYTLDRHMTGSSVPFTHICNFTRQYVQILVDQSASGADDTQIRDHRVVFTDLSQHPGDSKESIYRLRRVVASYDCALDIDVTTDTVGLFDNKIKDHLVALFITNFGPLVYAIEDQRVAYDESSKRVSATVQFVYQKIGGDDIIEVSQSLAIREQRTIDYTPIHNGDELAAYVDPGWAVLERVASRTVIVLGEEEPKLRLGVKPKEGPAGPIGGLLSSPKVVQSGWNIISNTSQTTPQWIGDPDERQIRVTVLTETVVERFNKKPKRSASTIPGQTPAFSAQNPGRGSVPGQIPGFSAQR